MNKQEWLAQLGAPEGLAHFANAGEELIAARDGSIAAPLADLGVIRAQGEDAASFLHNLLTNDVSKLGEKQTRRAGFCSPKGRLLADFLIWRDGADYLLALPLDILPMMLKKLSMYVLRSKVKLSDASDTLSLIGLAGPATSALCAQLGGEWPALGESAPLAQGQLLRLGEQRALIATPAPETLWPALTNGSTPAGLDAWRWLEIQAGDPRVIAATQDAFIPQMINYAQIGGLVFNKGCYPGQEIVARTQYLGKIKRHMYRARLSEGSATVGDSVYAPETGEQACGTVVSIAPAPQGGHEALLVIQTTCADAGQIRVGKPTGPQAEIQPLPYALG